MDDGQWDDEIPGQQALDLGDFGAAETEVPEDGWEYRFRLDFYGAVDASTLPRGWDWVRSPLWPGAPGGAVIATARAVVDPVEAVMATVGELEDAGARVGEVFGVSRYDGDGAPYREEQAVTDDCNRLISERPGHGDWSALEAARAAWAVRAGITGGTNMERRAQLTVWWDQYGGEDGTAELAAVADAYRTWMAGRPA
ncbi:hypothetical protein AB0A05_27130 [Streptomyces sp. NPDC046374]|uniref:hypothetical protein n=1 Tax=Streptomyces sp. NPDC046374 TaxID=3154917 RepID=UPI0033CB86AD